ncbi:DegT/DnrJ/EryC1/StrS aminotransferase [Corchorus olitorius]|uniref:DegT/DnrJ/EryC1/StrS aminotransferase n=1 Tax=Corchorus olitorius TaxID=93759 RepID=A0A1R3JMZ2_9ROSI|nr:DegT/DnrJ/EryC1/StrS aminotransferase [Corchorus olitorius]
MELHNEKGKAFSSKVLGRNVMHVKKIVTTPFSVAESVNSTCILNVFRCPISSNIDAICIRLHLKTLSSKMIRKNTIVMYVKHKGIPSLMFTVAKSAALLPTLAV